MPVRLRPRAPQTKFLIKNMKHINTWITLGIIFLLALQWQISKLDRKLTCIYNSVNALPVLVIPELRADRAALQEQIDYVESSCDAGYIFLGFPK